MQLCFKWRQWAHGKIRRTLPTWFPFFAGTIMLVVAWLQPLTVRADVIIDNDGPGTSVSGTWVVSGGVNPYGTESLYSNVSGNTYTFTAALATGSYQVYAWWTEYANRRTSVPYDIQHAGGTDTVTVNQQINGGQWNLLGTWNFGATSTVTLHSLGNGTTCTDAVRFVPVGGGEPVIFIDSFDDGDNWSSRWVQMNDTAGFPDWGVSNGQLQQQNNLYDYQASYHTGTYVILEDAIVIGLSDYSFSVDITPLPNNDGLDRNGNDIGVMFRYQDENNYYRVSMSARYGFTRFEKRIAGVFETLAVNAIGYIDNQPMTLTVIASGDILVVLIDGDPTFAVMDADIPSGTVALYGQDRVGFDNVQITNPPSQPLVVISSPLAYSVALTPENGNDLVTEAVVLNPPAGGNVVFSLNGGSARVASSSGNIYSFLYEGLSEGEYDLIAVLKDADGNEVSSDINSTVGVGGDYYVTVGDSITNGVGDLSPANNDSMDGRIVAIQGFQARLADSMTMTTGRPQTVFNEGVGGDRASDLNARINSIMERHPVANKLLLMIGTNDTFGNIPDPAYFKASVEATANIIDNMYGKQVFLAKTLPAYLKTDATTLDDSRNLAIAQFNAMIEEIVNADPDDSTMAGPDFYAIFMNLGNPLVYYYDYLHPNDDGYQVMADAWYDVLLSTP